MKQECTNLSLTKAERLDDIGWIGTLSALPSNAEAISLRFCLVISISLFVLSGSLAEHLSYGPDSAFGRDDFHARAIREHQRIELEVQNHLALKKNRTVFFVAFKHHL